MKNKEKKMKKITVALAILALTGSMVALGACGQAPADNNGKDGKPMLSGSITVTGSDTMLQLSTVFAEEFMKINPGIKITINGGGSGVGITQIIEGTTDLANASRDLKDSEREEAKAKGLTLEDVAVAYDGIAIVVNPQNPLTEVTIDQLSKIFTGEFKSWKDLGGEDQPIVVLSRENTSGTYAFFQEHVMAKKDYRKDAQFLPATAPIIHTTASDRWAIGYAGLGYALEAEDQVKILKVKKDDSSLAIEPTAKTILSKEYQISRALFTIRTAQKSNDAIKAFYDYMLSSEGQEIVAEFGFIPLK
jgi:phosphate transport system substrate-binding protein